MNDMFTFEPTALELLLDNLKPGTVLSALRLMQAAQQEDDSALEEAFDRLAEQGITLDISMLPADYGCGETENRLRMEEKLPSDLLRSLDESDPLALYLQELALIPAQGDQDILAQQLLEGDESASEKLVNLKLSAVVEEARAHTARGVLLLDLIQEGSLGLWQGVLHYTGGDIEVSLKDTALYTVSGDTVASEVGTYSLIFTLTDTDNYQWLGSEADASVTRYYKIGTALNGWAAEPQNITAVYDGNPVRVDAQALHGTVTVVYTIGGRVVDAPVGAGVYNVTVTATAENYTELVAHVTVIIEKAEVAAPTVDTLTFNGYEQTLTVDNEDLGVLYTVAQDFPDRCFGCAHIDKMHFQLAVSLAVFGKVDAGIVISH